MIEDCCGPEGTLELSPREAEDLAGVFKALADPVRLRLLSMIAGSENETCACDLTSPVARSQPTVSHHLSVLVNAGLVTAGAAWEVGMVSARSGASRVHSHDAPGPASPGDSHGAL